MVSLIILIILVVFTAFIFTYCIIKKQVLEVKNAVFFIPALLILLAIYILGYLDTENPFSLQSIFTCISAAFDGFKLSIKTAYVSSLMAKDRIFAIDVYWATTLAGLTLFSTVLGFFNVAINNYFKALTKRFRKLDIVIGDNDECVRYAMKHKNCVYWIDSNKQKLTSEDKKRLFLLNVTFFYQPFNGKKLRRFTRFNRDLVNIICFQKEGKYLATTINAIDGLKEGKKKYRFFVQAEEETISFVDERLTRKCQNLKNVMAASFDLYELIARDFNSQYNLAEFLPKEAINDYVVDKDYKINVVMLGFGKTAYAVFKGLLFNNQFVEFDKKTGQYHCHPINYYLFDKEANRFDRKLLSLFDSYKKENNKQIELPGVIKYETLNYKGNRIEEVVDAFSKEEKSFTYYFICGSSSIDDAVVAERIGYRTSENNTFIFYNADKNSEVLPLDKKNIVPFGFKEKMFSHDFIVNDPLWNSAAETNSTYNEQNADKHIDFNDLPIIEFLSNVYKNINLAFTLNCLGYEINKDKEGALKIEDVFKHVNPLDKYEYQDYLKPSLRTASAFQEHTRWNTLYYIYGFRPMPFNKIIFDDKNKKIIHKNHLDREHACLVSYYELDELFKYELDLHLKNNNKKELSEVESYCYDCLTLNDLKTNIVDKGLFIHKK